MFDLFGLYRGEGGFNLPEDKKVLLNPPSPVGCYTPEMV